MNIFIGHVAVVVVAMASFRHLCFTR